MKARVLDVGNCEMDHGNICQMLTAAFEVQVDRATLPDEAFDAVLHGQYRLVLVNRIFDADGSEGVELIRRLKADPRTRSVPVMLVSNCRDAQAAAQALGAIPGFGKAALDDYGTVKRLAPFLPAREDRPKRSVF